MHWVPDGRLKLSKIKHSFEHHLLDQDLIDHFPVPRLLGYPWLPVAFKASIKGLWDLSVISIRPAMKPAILGVLLGLDPWGPTPRGQDVELCQLHREEMDRKYPELCARCNECRRCGGMGGSWCFLDVLYISLKAWLKRRFSCSSGMSRVIRHVFL